MLGGGELARDIEAEVYEMVSEILSLAGVSGRLREVMLGRRDACPLPCEGAVPGDDISGLDVPVNRMVLGWFLRMEDGADDCESAVAGVLGWEGLGGVIFDSTAF